MTLSFSKYQGTGNDFIMIDATQNSAFSLNNKEISLLCDRRFGVGADGLIIIYKEKGVDFRMQYHNADGSQSFCGNGARCAVHFAHSLKLIEEKAVFLAIDGLHEATMKNNIISLKMNDVEEIFHGKDFYTLDTGSPHYVQFAEHIDSINMVDFGSKIRYSPTYKAQGINVNVAEIMDKNQLKIRTYERGVENETYSCGTGATAVALVYGKVYDKDKKEIAVDIEVKGGNLKVKAKRKNDSFYSIYLIGPAQKVFEGTYKM